MVRRSGFEGFGPERQRGTALGATLQVQVVWPMIKLLASAALNTSGSQVLGG